MRRGGYHRPTAGTGKQDSGDGRDKAPLRGRKWKDREEAEEEEEEEEDAAAAATSRKRTYGDRDSRGKKIKAVGVDTDDGGGGGGGGGDAGGDEGREEHEESGRPTKKKARVGGGGGVERRGGDARGSRTLRAKPGAALAQARREAMAIVPSRGKKIVF